MPLVPSKREIWEETGIEESQLTNLTCYHFILNKKYDQSYLSFYAKTNLSSNQIESLPRKDDEIEFKQRYFCKNEKKDIEKYLKKIRIACLMLLSLHYFITKRYLIVYTVSLLQNHTLIIVFCNRNRDYVFSLDILRIMY